MALYRFLFAPVLLAIAVATGSGSSDRAPAPGPSAPPASIAPETAALPAASASLHGAVRPRPVREH